MLKICFLYGLNKTVHHWWTDGQFWILHLYKCFESPLRDLLRSIKIFYRALWSPSNRNIIYGTELPRGDFIFPLVGLEICRWVAYILISPVSVGLPHPFPSNHGHDMILSLTPITHISMIGCISRIYWTQIYIFGNVKICTMVNIDKTLSIDQKLI